MSNTSFLYHSPDWYRSRLSEDYVNPKVKMMIKNDSGDWWDEKGIPEEWVGLYEEYWNTADFMHLWHVRIAEIFIEELRQENKAEYHGLIMGYGHGEEQYLKVVDEIARDMLIGSDKKLILFKKRIREEAQTPLQKKNKEKEIEFYGRSKGEDGLDEDEKQFTWNTTKGSQKDYYKELHYHICITSLMSAVEERIKMIGLEEIKTIKKIRATHTDRMEELEKIYTEDMSEGWVSKWLQIPIREQNNFVKQFEKNVEKVRKETEALQSNDDAMDRVQALMDRNFGSGKRLTGFE